MKGFFLQRRRKNVLSIIYLHEQNFAADGFANVTCTNALIKIVYFFIIHRHFYAFPQLDECMQNEESQHSLKALLQKYWIMVITQCGCTALVQFYTQQFQKESHTGNYTFIFVYSSYMFLTFFIKRFQD